MCCRRDLWKWKLLATAAGCEFVHFKCQFYTCKEVFLLLMKWVALELLRVEVRPNLNITLVHQNIQYRGIWATNTLLTANITSYHFDLSYKTCFYLQLL